MSNQTPDIVMVLGMHRSGTSMLTEALHHLGLGVADGQLAPEPAVNHRGFWEDGTIVDINEQILGSLDSHWCSIAPLPGNWPRTEALQNLQDSAEQHLRHTYSGRLPAVIKDPRMCRLLPFWQPLMERCQWRTACVLMLRHPAAVAASLQRRNGLPTDYGLLLWLRYMLDAAALTEGLPRIVLDYDRLLESGPALLTRELAGIGLGGTDTGPELHETFDATLRHHRQSDVSAPDASSLHDRAMEVYHALLSGEKPPAGAFPPLHEPAIPATMDALTHALLNSRSQLIHIGELHEQATGIVRERDAQLERCNREREQAEAIVRDRDRQLEQRNADCEYAESLILERDRELRQCNEEREYAEQIVRQRDRQLQELEQRMNALRASLPGRLALRWLRMQESDHDARDD